MDGTENQTVTPDSRTNSEGLSSWLRLRATHAGTALPGGEHVECGEVERKVEQLRQPVRLVQVVARRNSVEKGDHVRLAHEHAFRAARTTRCEQQVGRRFQPPGGRVTSQADFLVSGSSAGRHQQDWRLRQLRRQLASCVQMLRVDDDNAAARSLEHVAIAQEGRARIEGDVAVTTKEDAENGGERLDAPAREDSAELRAAPTRISFQQQTGDPGARRCSSL